MFFNLFGNFLVENGQLTDSQLAEIKATKSKTRVKLGLIGVSENMLTEKQAEEINRKQAILDKRFGDIAIELGYLTGEQVTKLLDLQGNAYMLLCQTITDKGYMTLAEIDEAFKAYVEKTGISEENINGFKANDIDSIIPVFLPDKDEAAYDLISVVVRTINRLISTDIYMDKAFNISEYTDKGFAYQTLEGDMLINTCIAGPKDAVLIIADSFAGEKFADIDEDSLDSVGEFINVVNGLYATSLSYKKVNVDMLPPVLCTSETTIKNKNMYNVPLFIDGKALKLIIGIN